MDETKPVSSDVSHFCTLTSPNSMPRTMTKKTDTPAMISDRP